MGKKMKRGERLTNEKSKEREKKKKRTEGNT